MGCSLETVGFHKQTQRWGGCFFKSPWMLAWAWIFPDPRHVGGGSFVFVSLERTPSLFMRFWSFSSTNPENRLEGLPGRSEIATLIYLASKNNWKGLSLQDVGLKNISYSPGLHVTSFNHDKVLCKERLFQMNIGRAKQASPTNSTLWW